MDCHPKTTGTLCTMGIRTRLSSKRIIHTILGLGAGEMKPIRLRWLFSTSVVRESILYHSRHVAVVPTNDFTMLNPLQVGRIQ